MEPLYKEGSLLVAVKTAPLVGKDILLRDPREKSRILLKRLVKMDSEGMFVEGLNRGMSTDSKEFGKVSKENYVARVLFRLW